MGYLLLVIGTAVASIRSFEDLECWRACRTLRLFVAREVVPHLPQEERFRLGDQLICAARSTTAQCSGTRRTLSFLDNAKFCSNARGSCRDVLDHLVTARDELLISEERLVRGRELAELAVKNYLKRASSTAPRGAGPTPGNE